MKFRTEVSIKPQPDSISYKTEMLSIGSCFADEIGQRLKDLSFPIEVQSGRNYFQSGFNG
jgi:hypothetical protein